MVKTCRMLLAALVLLWPLAGAMAQETGGWSHTASIELQGGSRYKAVFLPDAVYEHAQPDLADLRLTDSSGNYVPYYLQSGIALQQHRETALPLQITHSFQAAEDSYVDYTVVVGDHVDPVGSGVEFALPAQTFLKHIEIYGSYDGYQWQYIAADYLFKIDDKEKNQVAFGQQLKFSHYRIRIRNNSEDIALGQARLIDRLDNTVWQQYQRTTALAYDITTNGRQTVIHIANPQMLKVGRLTLDIGTANFQRRYTLHSGEPSSRQLQAGALYQLQFAGVDVSKREIVLPTPVVANNMIVKIDNHDDRPLDIQALQAVYYVDKLVFADLGAGPYQLHFGNDKARAASYDIQQQRSYIEQEQQDQGSVQNIVRQQVSRPGKPAVINEGYLLNGVIVVISLLLIYMLASKIGICK